jgi:hypothetical protein
MPHLPPAHHETSKHDSPNETRINEKQNETIPDLNSTLAKSMTQHNQTKERITWFLTLIKTFTRKIKRYTLACDHIASLKTFHSKPSCKTNKGKEYNVMHNNGICPESFSP